MPSYDLHCEACEHTFETFRHGFLRDEDRVCPACGEPQATQLLTGGFVAVTSRRGGEPAAAVSAGPSCGGHCGCGGH